MRLWQGSLTQWHFRVSYSWQRSLLLLSCWMALLICRVWTALSLYAGQCEGKVQDDILFHLTVYVPATGEDVSYAVSGYFGNSCADCKELAPSPDTAWFKENCRNNFMKHFWPCAQEDEGTITRPPPPRPELCNEVALSLCHLLLSQGWKTTVKIPSASKPCLIRVMSLTSLFLFFVISWAMCIAFCFLALEYVGSWGGMCS